jgi:hypothetical protein
VSADEPQNDDAFAAVSEATRLLRMRRPAPADVTEWDEVQPETVGVLLKADARVAERAAVEDDARRSVTPAVLPEGWQVITLPVEAWAELLDLDEHAVRRMFDMPTNATAYSYHYEKRPDFKVMDHLRRMAVVLGTVPPHSSTKTSCSLPDGKYVPWTVERTAIDSRNRTVQVTLAVAWADVGLG